MDSFESQLAEVFKMSSFGRKANGTIEFDLDGGSVAYMGELKGGVFSKPMFVGDFFESINYDINTTMSDLYEHSKTLSEGPIYKCIIILQRGKTTVNFYWENKSISSIDEIALDTHGNMPMFAYRKYFSKELIQLSDNYSLATGQPSLVEELIKTGQNVPPQHMEIYALYDWISDTNNGGFGQYFARNTTWSNAGLSREKMYPLVRSALSKIQRPNALLIYDEAVALYAHFHEKVEQARIQMNIPAVPKREESDIGDRYYDMLPSLEEEIGCYIRSNKEVFAYH